MHRPVIVGAIVALLGMIGFVLDFLVEGVILQHPGPGFASIFALALALTGVILCVVGGLIEVIMERTR